jgi:hypothetical protein
VEACTSRRGAAGLDNTWDPPRISSPDPPAPTSTAVKSLSPRARERERRDGVPVVRGVLSESETEGQTLPIPQHDTSITVDWSF